MMLCHAWYAKLADTQRKQIACLSSAINRAYGEMEAAAALSGLAHDLRASLVASW